MKERERVEKDKIENFPRCKQNEKEMKIER